VTDADATLESHGAVDTVLYMASVTKPLVAYGVLVAIDQGRVELDTEVLDNGATVRHLLAHASGLPFEGDGPISTLGSRRIYSNRGFEVLAGHVEGRVGRSLPEFLRQQVFVPLEMYDTDLRGHPGAEMHGTVTDLLRFARELLRPTLIEPDLHAAATTVVFPGLSGVLPGFGRQDANDWGLGFEIRDHKEPHWTGTRNAPATFGHFGQSGSFLWVDPDVGLACASLSDRDFGAWCKESWPPLSDAVIETYG
jgi:CubicO group peptidase (beta-lactamase class C family)